MRSSRLLFFVGMAMLLAPVAAHADRRNFVWVYEPRTMPKGGLELEWYMTATVNRIADKHEWEWVHQIEAEYGITDKIDVSMYQMFNTSAWLGYKLRSRYRPFDEGQLPIDMLFYLEFIQLNNADVELEEKIILGHTFGRLVLSLDSAIEEGPLGRSPELSITEGLGIGFELRPWITFGLETQLRLRWERAEFTKELRYMGPSVYLGPTASLATGRFFWNFNFSVRAGVPDNDNPGRFLLRVLWGIFI